MLVEIKLSAEQLPILARLIAQEIGYSGVARTAPYGVHEAAAAIGISAATVRRRVNAGVYRSVDGAGRVLIPAAEVQRILAGEPKGGNEQ